MKASSASEARTNSFSNSELFHRRSAPMGVSQFASADGSAVRVARDPLLGVYPLIRPYVGLGGIG